MNNQNSLIITQSDYQKLKSLFRLGNAETTELLEEELDRAMIVADDQLPSDVVSMNSKVKFRDTETGNEKIVTLVFPHDSNTEESKISILAPIGSALIGLRVGQTIDWPMPNGKKKCFKVVSVFS